MTLSSLLLIVSVCACRDLVGPSQPSLRPDTPRHDFNGSPAVIVTPDSMRGWQFINDQGGTACTTPALYKLVSGPGGVPVGSGSAELATPMSSDGIAIVRVGYNGVRLDRLTDLSYSSYRQIADAGNTLAIALQLNADYDLTDSVGTYQGRLVYEPYHTAPGGVPQSTWQRWDTRAGRWWGTRAKVTKHGVSVNNPCVQASPCTWAQLLALFPDAGIHTVYGAILLKAGSGWAGFRGNVDAVSIGIDGVTTTFDFELPASMPVPAVAPDSVPQALWDSLTQPSNLILNGPGGKIIRDLLSVKFKPTATLADRQNAIALINGTVIGGFPLGRPEHFYYVRIPYNLSTGDSALGPILRAANALEALPSIESATIVALDFIRLQYRRPIDGAGYTSWNLSRDSASGANWGQTAVNASFAWGCVTGMPSGQPAIPIAIVDRGFHNGVTTTFDFEASGPTVPLIPPDSFPTELFAALGTVSGSPLLDSAYRKDIVIVAFQPTATQAQRQAAIDSIGGQVVGGHRDKDGVDGYYYVRITGGTTAALLSAVTVLHRQPQVQGAMWWEMYDRHFEAYRRPVDGIGWTN